MKPTMKKDGFYNEAHNILHTPISTSIRIKLRSRSQVVAKPTAEKIETFNCISCFSTHNVFERNIRGRILRGYLVTKHGNTTIQHLPGVPVKPCYHNGRLCEACFSKYSVQATTPTDYSSIQLLKDFAKTVTHDPSVTVGGMLREDEDQEAALNQAKLDARPKWKGRLAINIVGEVGNHHKRRYHCTECSSHNGNNNLRCSACGSLVTTEELDLDPNAFRRFMRSRGKKGGTGIKDYEKRLVDKIDAKHDEDLYDNAIDYSEVKK